MKYQPFTLRQIRTNETPYYRVSLTGKERGGDGLYMEYFRISLTRGVKVSNNFDRNTWVEQITRELGSYLALRKLLPIIGIRIPTVFGMAVVSHPKYHSLLPGYVVQHIPHPSERGPHTVYYREAEAMLPVHSIDDIHEANLVIHSKTRKPYLIDFNCYQMDIPGKTFTEIKRSLKLVIRNEEEFVDELG